MSIVRPGLGLRYGFVTAINTSNYSASVRSELGDTTIPLAVARDDVSRVFLVELAGRQVVALPDDLFPADDSLDCPTFLLRG